VIDHDEIQELLAGYVLRSLSGEDAVEADRILTEHVPGCADCRATLDAFQVVAGDLALDASSVTPPDTLRAKLRRELEPRGRAGGRFAGRWNAGRIVAVAASVVVVVGVGAVALTRGGDGLVNGQLARADLQDVTNAATADGASQTHVGGSATEISSPATEKLYVYGADVPLPPAGMVYRLWAGTQEDPLYIGDFLPSDDGMLLLEITLPVSSVGPLFVTLETAGSAPTTPGERAWTSEAA
jgi:Anti-sigma-K factor rskA, C-terminal